MTAATGFWRSRFADGEPAMVAPHYRDRIESSLMALDELSLGQATAAAGDEFWTELGQASGRLRPYSVTDGVLVLPVRGVLLNSFPYQVGAYATGYEYIWRAFERGMSDPEVKGIALIVDSPGGMVSGNFDLVDRMHAMRARKPVRAYVSDAAYSAAYSIASAAREIIVSRTGGTGSIGIVTAHLDVSQAMERDGFRMTFIYAGKHKVDGNPYAPLSEDARARIQSRVDSLQDIFVETVARNRDVPAKDVRDTEAATYGPGESLVYGLADRLGSISNIAADFSGTPTTRSMKDVQMTTTTDIPRSEAEARAHYAATPALQSEFPTNSAYVAFMRHQARKAGRPWPPTSSAAGQAPEVQQPESQQEAAAGAEWDASAALQAEFPNRRGYVLWKRHEADKAART